jgi:malate synthase
MEVFDRLMPGPNQLAVKRDDVDVTEAELVEMHKGKRTEEDLRENIRVGVQYIEAWLRGRGAVPIYNLMEDAATAEISRAQVWQWLQLKARLDDGHEATPELFRQLLESEMSRVKGEVGAAAYEGGRFPEAIKLFTEMSLADSFEEFLTIPAYRLID